MKVLIVAKQNKLGIRMAKKLEKRLKELISDVHFDMSTGIKLRKRGISVSKFDGDAVITVGGDGTFLRTSSQTNIPILPVKIEGHGFLCTASFKDLMENIDRFVSKHYKIIEKMRLNCTKIKKGRFAKILHKSYPLSLNEIVFARKRPSKILILEFIIDGVLFEVKGDGMLVSTPSGSTGYSASAGGSVIDSKLELMKIVPLYPFFSKLKPMVIPADKKIEVYVKKGDCAVIIDGHGGEYVKPDSEFIIEKGEPIKLISLGEQNFYQKFKDEFLE